jgi:arsenate reductase (glutaredoxin)
LLKSLRLTAHEVASTKSPSYKKLGLDNRSVSEDELIALMVQEPRLIRRPLIVVNGRSIVGFDKAKIVEVLKR